MFEHLDDRPIIIVTGPQRSGTTICARMIANDLERTYIDEGRFAVYDLDKAMSEAKRWKPCVIQGPGLMKDYLYWANDPDVTTVVMRRDILDIIKSQKRIGWGYAREVLDRYFQSMVIAHPFYEVADIQYALWDNMNMDLIGESIWEIPYESLSEHPMWIDKEDRIDFGKRQYKK